MNNIINDQKNSIESKQEEFQNASIVVTKNAVRRLKGVMKSDKKKTIFSECLLKEAVVLG